MREKGRVSHGVVSWVSRFNVIMVPSTPPFSSWALVTNKVRMLRLFGLELRIFGRECGI